MGRYYLHIRDFTGAMVEDEDGSELSSLAVAKEHAMLAMHELVGDAVKRGGELQIEAIIITDKLGTHLAAIPLLASLPSAMVDLLKRPEKVLPANKMEEYRRNADQCRHKAENTADLDDKMSWLRLADAWLQMLPSSRAPSSDLAGWPKASDDDSQASH